MSIKRSTKRRSGKLVVVYAESGLGKTSLLNAGVSALLRERGFLPIKVRFNMAGISPVQAVYIGIILNEAWQHLDLEAGETESLWHYFKTAAFWSPDDSLLTPVLIFDQFEEFFAFHEPMARSEFIRQLADLVHNTLPSTLRQAIRTGQPYRYGEEPPRVKTVISIRGDYLGQLDEFSATVPEILDNRFRLLALTRKQAREAITGPAQIQDEQIFTPSFRYSEEALNTILDYLSRRRERGGVVSKDEDAVQLYKKAIVGGVTDIRVYNGLLKILSEAGKEDAEYVWIYQEIRDVLKQTNDTATLETLYGIALNVKSKNAYHYFQLGNDYSDFKKYDAAIASYRKALELKPTDLIEKGNLALLYLTTERFDKAMALAHEVLKEKNVPQVHRLFLATKLHKGTRRKKEYLNPPNEKFLGVQNPFFKKGFGRRRQRVAVDLGPPLIIGFFLNFCYNYYSTKKVEKWLFQPYRLKVIVFIRNG